MGEWTKFFLVRMVLAMLTVGVVVEAAAYLLSSVALHRHNVDDLADAVLHDRRPYKVVLLGDSVTHNVSHKFRIGDPDEVADMTTHAAAGLPSSLFLLKRYLESGHRPRQVVLAVSVHELFDPVFRPQFNYYLASVFTEPSEKAFLVRYFPDYVDYRWRPAALSVMTHIGEPLFSLLRHPDDQIWVAPGAPSPHPTLETFSASVYDEAEVRKRINEIDGPIRPEVRAILDVFCALSRQYGFEIHFLRPPMLPAIHEGMLSSGKLQALDEHLAEIFRQDGVRFFLYDINIDHVFPYFDQEMLHVKGLGWEQTYALELTKFIHTLEFDAR